MHIQEGRNGLSRSRRAECRSQDADLTPPCLQPAIMQQPPHPLTTTSPNHHPPWRGLGGSAGDSEIALPLRGPGGGTGQDSDLISQEGKEKGGVRWIRVRLSLYFTLFFSPLLTVTCGMNATEEELLHTQSRSRPNLVTILSRNNKGLRLPRFR